MAHDIKNNRYDVKIVEEEILDTKHVIKVRTFVNGEEYVKQFNFTHDQTPGGSKESWKKHIRHWIDKLERKEEKCKTCEKEETDKFNVGK